ncbi:MAG: hypothetical protein PHV34_14725 [Verrucomicrobiae bacterium]|nr:hypothetical protein [Verrucomicrobiae bacterium]
MPNENQVQTRELLIKYLKAPPGEKPLTEPEFKQIADLVDIKRGGLKPAAYDQFKDKEILRAAYDHQVNRVRAQALEAREPLLKLLDAKPTEPALSFDEYRKVLRLVDLQKGGITHHAYEVFREDKAITEAAAKHRKAIVEIQKETPGKDPNAARNANREPTAKERDEVLSQVRVRRSKQPSAAKAVGVGIGE